MLLDQFGGGNGELKVSWFSVKWKIDRLALASG